MVVRDFVYPSLGYIREDIVVVVAIIITSAHFDRMLAEGFLLSMPSRSIPSKVHPGVGMFSYVIDPSCSGTIKLVIENEIA